MLSSHLSQQSRADGDDEDQDGVRPHLSTVSSEIANYENL